jgi:capsid portal protein
MNNNLHIMEFNAAQVPQFQEVIKNKPYVFYGDDNIFPNHLLALYQYSSINRACLNAIIYGVKGKGLYVKEGNPEALTMANRSETVYEVFEKIVTDRVIFGGLAMNIVKSNDGDIAEFYHTDFSRLRAGKEDDFGNVGTYYYSIDWKGTTVNPNKWKPIEIEAFNMLPNSSPTQILYDKTCYMPGMSYYPAPDYLAGLTTIQLDIEIKNFHLNNMQNSMMPSMAVSFTNGVPGEEAMDMIERQLSAKYSSTNNAGKFFLFFSENPETAPQITPIPNNASDAWYSNMAPQVEQTILTAHRITSPMILGIKTEGQLGGRAEILDAYQLFLQTVIIPIQEEILRTLEKVLFIKYKEPIKLGITQNQILPDEVQSEIDKKEGI